VIFYHKINLNYELKYFAHSVLRYYDKIYIKLINFFKIFITIYNSDKLIRKKKKSLTRYLK